MTTATLTPVMTSAMIDMEIPPVTPVLPSLRPEPADPIERAEVSAFIAAFDARQEAREEAWALSWRMAYKRYIGRCVRATYAKRPGLVDAREMTKFLVRYNRLWTELNPHYQDESRIKAHLADKLEHAFCDDYVPERRAARAIETDTWSASHYAATGEVRP